MNSGAREEETVPASYYTQSSYIYTVNSSETPGSNIGKKTST